MKPLKNIVQLIFLLCLYSNLAGQERFECNGGILISSVQGDKTHIFKPAFPPFAPPYLGILGIYEGHYDGLGFNPRDSYVYGVEQNSKNIVRFSLYTKVDKIGTVVITDTLKVNAGDCNSDGLYFCYDYGLHKMLVFDVVNQFKLVRQINLFWDPTSPNRGAFKTRLFDFAFSPNESKTAYSYQGNSSHPDLAPTATSGRVLKINLNFDDPNLGMVTPISYVNPNDASHISGLAFNSDANLFGFGSSGNVLNPPQNSYFGIEPLEGKITKLITHNVSPIISDACSCPFSIRFTNIVPQDGMFCNNDTREFQLGIQNNSLVDLKDIVLKDTFPSGTIIKSVTSTFKGKIDAGSGVGTNILSISELLVPALGKISITIELVSVNAKDGFAYNQAFLQKLPPHLPVSFGSDDPLSSTANDRSNFHFITKNIEKISWKVSPPTNCLPANDGKILVTSPEFLVGKTYEVSLRNKMGWDERFEIVTIDDKNSFFIDSLLPGDYQMFRFRALDNDCGVSLKDTTFIIEAPHHLLNLQLTSNNPVCEGDNITLSSTQALPGIVSWTGPSFFGSADPITIIESAGSQNRGRYELETSSGFCKQKKAIDIEVKSQFKASVEGDSSYCARDTIRLFPKANQGSITYKWLGPNNLKTIDSILIIPKVDNRNDGKYTLVATNGACFDTLTMKITILPTPSVTMSQSIVTDFCDPILLKPEVNDDKSVSYEWRPSQGLSCYDCENPQIQPIVQSRYLLKVENQYKCTDSTSIQIRLNKERIIVAPNVFSLSGSEINKLFKLIPSCVVHYIESLEIYHRSGNLVFSTKSNDPNNDILSWNGQSTGGKAAPGVYIWTAKVQLIDGSVIRVNGDITLL